MTTALRLTGPTRDLARQQVTALADAGHTITRIARRLRITRYLARRLLTEATPCQVCTGTGGDHQIGCQPHTPTT